MGWFALRPKLRGGALSHFADGTIGDGAFQRVEEELDWTELDWVLLTRQ